MDKQVTVLGAGFAGCSAALQLSRRGFDVKVVDVKGTHEYIPGVIDVIRDRVSEDKLQKDLHTLFSSPNIDFTREKVESVDPDKRVIETNAGAHNYEYLVVALGGEANTFGMDVSDAVSPYDLGSAKKINERLEDGEEALIVGSGYVGIEFAGELADKGNKVTMVDQNTRPMSRASEKASEIALAYLNSREINFRGGNTVVEVNSDSVKLDDGRTIEGDLVIWSGGVKASEVITESFDTDSGGLMVDQHMQSPEYPKVFAVGDSAKSGTLKTAHNAMREGITVGKNVGKSKSNMTRYRDRIDPLIVSLGDTAMFTAGDFAFKSRAFRWLKDIVRVMYFTRLRAYRVIS